MGFSLGILEVGSVPTGISRYTCHGVPRYPVTVWKNTQRNTEERI